RLCVPGMPKTVVTPCATRLSMTAAPPVTGSGCCSVIAVLVGGHRADQLVRRVRGGDPGHLGVVVRRRDLDDVGADEVQPAEGAQDVEQLAAGEAAGLGRAGARGVSRVKDVDVERDVRRPVADTPPDLLDGAAPA